jgi:uncharacterized phage-associated protein
MAASREVIAYLLVAYPHKHELSRSRLMSMVYLADWKSAIEHRRQMTDTRWTLGSYGPFAQEVYDVIEEDAAFETVIEENVHGTTKGRVTLVGEIDLRALAPQDRDILDFVVESSQPLRWTEFVGLVYSTYPMMVVSEKGESLDLVGGAADYSAAQEVLRHH